MIKKIFFCRYTVHDATKAFEESKHSQEAREMMQAFFVGIFVEVKEKFIPIKTQPRKYLYRICADF